MYELLEKKGKRRLGVLHTMHGPIFTPAFGPDATRGLVRNIAPHELINLSGDVTLSLSKGDSTIDANDQRVMVRQAHHDNN